MLKASPLFKLKTAVGAVLAVASGCTFAEINIIPRPNQVHELKEADFKLTGQTCVRFDKNVAAEAKVLVDAVKKATGLTLRLIPENTRVRLQSEIHVDVVSGEAEAYSLAVTPRKIEIKGGDAAGTFYGVQSLLQLIPLKGKPVLPGCHIIDKPRFGWRGMHLDVGRHFFPKKNIKTFIDQLAAHKMNIFHWHLTEDQGWRIEIKKYPKLTQVGAWRKATPPYGHRWQQDGKRYGGFYTQKEIREIVAYAEARHITIVPEIDMPGHMAAAIASYPELGNDDVPDYNPEVKTFWGVHPYTLSPKESTFKWIDDVLTEVCALFDSEYIHIGGDEAPKKQWKQSKFAQEVMKREGCKNEHDLQSYMIKRIEKILEAKGRKLIGWDEIREGGLSPNATVMLWRGWNHAVESIKEGHDVVMAPTSHTYFDHYQNKPSKELAKGVEFECIGGYRPLDSVYAFDPVPVQFQGTEKAKHILGCQGQLWTEYMHTWDKVEYCAFPRIAALAEVAWTEKASKGSFEAFSKRLNVMAERYKNAGINAFDQSTFFVPKPLKGFKVATSLKGYGDHQPFAVIDGDPQTFFWSNSGPVKGDYFTVSFDRPKSGEKVIIKTGKASEYADALENGVLEASADGKVWNVLTRFEKGAAQATLPAAAKAIRIRCTKNQNSWLQIQEIDFLK